MQTYGLKVLYVGVEDLSIPHLRDRVSYKTEGGRMESKEAKGEADDSFQDFGGKVCNNLCRLADRVDLGG